MTQANQPCDVTVVVPVRNAEGAIASAIDALTGRLEALGCSFELLVVDDGSEDASAQEASRIAMGHPELRVIQLPSRSGPGYAARMGLLAGTGVYRVLTPVLEGGGAVPGSWEAAMAHLAAGAAVAVAPTHQLLAVDSRLALPSVEAAYRHGSTFVEEVVRLARKSGLEVAEVEVEDPRGGIPGPPRGRAFRDLVNLVVEFRWPWAAVD